MHYKIISSLAVALVFLLSQLSVSAEEPQLNTRAVKASERLLMDIKEVINGRLVAVGERGHILISDNKGNDWRQILVPTEALLTKLFFINDKIGWAVGHEQTILKTTTAGETWTLQRKSDSLDQPALFDIWFKDDQTGFAVGAYGLYLKTLDGGQTWEEIYQEALEDEEIGFPHFYSIAQQPDSKHLFMAGELGFLAKSEDLGETWKKLPSPYAGSFFNIIIPPNGDLLVMGLRGHLFQSSNSGESWAEVNTGTISGLQEATILNNKLLIVGSDGTILESNDFGKSVELNQRSDRVHLANVIFLNESEVLLVGIKGVIAL